MEKYKIVAYTRESTAHQTNAGSYGISAQVKEIENFAELNSLSIVEYISETASGGNNQRDGLANAIRLAKENNAYLAVSKVCRLARSVSKVSQLLEDDELDLIVTSFGMASNKMMIQLFSVIAEFQRSYLSEATKKGLEQAKLRGVKLGSPSWNNNIHRAHKANTDSADAFALKIKPIISELNEAGVYSYSKLARSLTARGIRTARNKKNWTHKSVSNILCRINKLQPTA